MNLSCGDIVRYKDRLFILTRDTQCLFEYYPTSKKINLCGTVRNKWGQLFISMALCMNKIYIAPYEAEEICVYDIEKKKFYRIPLDKKWDKGKRKHYKICFSYQHKIYFLGGKETVMLCVDADTDMVEEIIEWGKKFKSEFGFETWVRTHQHVCIVDHCFWVALEGNNILLQYNMLTKEYFFWNIGIKKMQYVTICFDGEYFWISGEEKVIIRWKKETNEIKEFYNFPEGFQSNNIEKGWKELFSCGYIWNENIYFSPLNANMLLKFNRISNQMKCIIKTDVNHACFSIAEIGNRELYIEECDIKTSSFNKSYFINENDEYRKDSICIKNQDVLYGNFMIEDMKIEGNIIIESFPLCILKLCNMLKNKKIYIDNFNQNSVGRNIWKYL